MHTNGFFKFHSMYNLFSLNTEKKEQGSEGYLDTGGGEGFRKEPGYRGGAGLRRVPGYRGSREGNISNMIFW